MIIKHKLFILFGVIASCASVECAENKSEIEERRPARTIQFGDKPNALVTRRAKGALCFRDGTNTSIKYTQGNNPSDIDIKTLQISDKEMEPWRTVAKIFYPNNKTIVFTSKDEVEGFKNFFTNCRSEDDRDPEHLTSGPTNAPTVSLKGVDLLTSTTDEKRKENSGITREAVMLKAFTDKVEKMAKTEQKKYKRGDEATVEMKYESGDTFFLKTPIEWLSKDFYTNPDNCWIEWEYHPAWDWGWLCSSTCNGKKLAQVRIIPEKENFRTYPTRNANSFTYPSPFICAPQAMRPISKDVHIVPTWKTAVNELKKHECRISKNEATSQAWKDAASAVTKCTQLLLELKINDPEWKKNLAALKNPGAPSKDANKISQAWRRTKAALSKCAHAFEADLTRVKKGTFFDPNGVRN
jgi:hypothetical protein